MADLIVIGAGAAGLFAAGSALREGHRVVVLEHMAAPGKKLLITGKGRCNLANDCAPDEFLKHVRRNPRFLYSALAAMPPRRVMELFESLGVALKTERGRRVYPVSDRAQDVRDALLRYAQGADLRLGATVEKLLIEDGCAVGVVMRDGSPLRADAVLIATGGVSYPATGSTGDGYRFARQAGHTIIPPEPSLVALVERGGIAKRMQGLSLRNVSLTLYEEEKPVFSDQGEMLFTHFGVSGPLVLSASAHLRDVKAHRCRIEVDLKPALDEEKLEARVRRDFSEFSGRDASKCLDRLVPASMRPVLIDLWGIDPAKKTNQITRTERKALVALLKAFPIEIADKGDLAHAVVTSGGVCVREVDPKTMQSKRCSGLYFAGEVLDLDGYTGGYNLGIAFATAHAAATHLPG